MAGLGINKDDYPNSHFLLTKPMNDQGLTVSGKSEQYGEADLFEQDSSILGWTCGNLAASARDVAKFYYKLLGPGNNVVSQSSLIDMMGWMKLDKGWEANYIQYGAGLMIQNVEPFKGYRPTPSIDDLGTYIGHGGDTYGFMSDNGFFPQINASISVIVNVDYDYYYPSNLVTCPIAEIAATHHTGKKQDFKCGHATVPTYSCQTKFGQKYCGIEHHKGTTKAECEKTCKNDTSPSFVESLFIDYIKK